MFGFGFLATYFYAECLGNFNISVFYLFQTISKSKNLLFYWRFFQPPVLGIKVLILVECKSNKFIFLNVLSDIVLVIILLHVTNKILFECCKISLKQVVHHVISSLYTRGQSLMKFLGALITVFNVQVYH